MANLKKKIFKYRKNLFSTALRKQQKILTRFPEDKFSTIYLDLQNSKSFHPQAFNASSSLLEDQ